MHTDSDVPVLVVSGTIGAGKSTVLDEIHDVLCSMDSAHACIDIDAVSYSWPQRGAFNHITALENLRSLWANFRAAGASRLAIAGVVERVQDIEAFRDAVPGARITVCRLIASESTRIARLNRRQVGAGLQWHLQRTTELESVLDACALHDFVVVNEDRAIRHVAVEVLIRAGWLTMPHETAANRR